MLLLDNCPAHSPEESLVSRDGKIQVMYLPKNTTSKIQPQDQGIISSFKRVYRKELMRDILEQDASITHFLKDLSLKDAMYLLARALDSVSAQSIHATWTKALGNPTDHPEPEDQEEDFFGFSDTLVAQVKDKVFALLQERPATQDFLTTWAAQNDLESVSAPTGH